MGDILTFVKWTYISNSSKSLDNTRLSRNFTLSEFSCHCGFSDCNYTLVSQKLIDGLQKLRDTMAEPIRVLSGYRCERHNIAIGGSPTSKHMEGLAADVRTFNQRSMDHLLASTYSLAGVGGIGRYYVNNKLVRLHIDYRPKVNKLIEWDERK